MPKTTAVTELPDVYTTVITLNQPKILIYDSRAIRYRIIYNFVLSKQKGLCYHCHKYIAYGDTIVRKRGSSGVKYYHFECGEKIHLVEDLSSNATQLAIDL